MKPGIRLFSFLIILLIVQTATAQHAPLDFNLIKKFNGITLGKINSITQDRNGYMWFADQGNNALIRFDGHEMKRYTYDPSDSNSFDSKGSSGGIECIAADSSGYIWVNAATGIDKLDPATNKFTHFRYSRAEVRGINAILIDHLNNVWISTTNGLDLLDQRTGKFTHYTHSDNDPTSISCNNVRCLYEDHQGVLWVGTGWEFDSSQKEGGLNRFNRETGTFTRYMHNADNLQSLAGDKVRAIFEDSRGIFWVGTDGDGLHIMDRKAGTFERLTHDPTHPEKLSRPPVKTGREFLDHITFIAEDGAGAIWVGTFYAGIMRYDPATKEITHFDSTDKSRPKGYTENSSWCAFTSREGVLWVATEFDENLFRVDPLQSGISNIVFGDEVTSMYNEVSGNSWIGGRNNGLLRISANKAIKKTYKHDSSDPYSISSNEITFIQPDTNGLYWVGTFNGLNHFDSKTGRFTRYFYSGISKGDFHDTAVFHLLKGDHDELYISTTYGFFVLYSQAGAVEHYMNNATDTSTISNNFVTDIVKDKSGDLWIGTWSNTGLNLFNTKSKKFTHYLLGSVIESIYKDKRGIIWVGTNSGLYYRKDSLASFIAVDEWKKEFRVAAIQISAEDEYGNIWGNSSLGIFRYNLLKHELCIYSQKFGINDNAAFRKANKARDGGIWFGKSDGYYSFFPKSLINNTAPQIIITDFKIKEHSISPGKDAPFKQAIEETKEINLQYKENSFSIDFAAIHYSSPEENISYYILEGYDSSWIKSDSTNAIDYRNIPTGKYLFKIKSRSSYGVWSEKEIKIIISPPWWLTWWALTLSALVLFLFVWGIIKWRTSTIEKEKTVLEKKVEERTKELKKEKEIVESTLSELKSTQAQLVQSEKMASLGELTAGIAHEIQNPLNFVNNFSELNKELVGEMQQEIDKGNLEEIKSIAKNIEENQEKINYHGKRADAIVKSMLQHSRISSGQKEFTDINALVDEYLRLAYHGWRAKDKSFNAKFETALDESIEKINIVSQDVGRVILNLINNAFYAVNEKKKTAGADYEPVISVRTKKSGNRIYISVSDNGKGIPKNIVDKIFQPFFTTKPSGQGTGLGLSLSYDIVKAHGGNIKVESNENIGSNFTIELPVTQ